MGFVYANTTDTQLYTLSLHDALPISRVSSKCGIPPTTSAPMATALRISSARSEEHTSELQSRLHLVCRLLLEKKNAVRPDVHACKQFLHKPGLLCWPPLQRSH